MKKVALLVMVLMLIVMSGCAIHHESGSMPQLSFPEIEKVCTDAFRVKTKSGGVIAECRFEINGGWII
jgi:hypothetical protein